ncbi:MAG: thioredoxin domain-containing protein, partial [Anaerolineae bacterium]|nr:thioredoxin domain-containing protein [Anaerolineae bacterium]
MNHLANETSPYLLQHKDNPVDWYPWGDEALAKAKAENKPILLSIGYSACHWCHVMAHESFEHEDTAEIMNRHYVNIKVDREERPDVDNTYMAVCQMMTGSGGWPLNLILAPDKKPFFAATYIPRTSRAGLIGLDNLLAKVAEMWSSERDRLLHTGEEIG